MKITAQEEGKPTIRNIAKLLMNSMYGRFGMHADMTQTKIVSYSERVELGKSFTIQSSIQLGSFYLVNYVLASPPLAAPFEANKLIELYTRKDLPARTNVAIASAVTAYSRVIINSYKIRALEQNLNIYYSDTDSLVTNGELPSDLIDSAEPLGGIGSH